MIERPDTKKALDTLKDFQRDTVEYVFDRLYGKDPVDRFLVADEVGLGKTMIARGVAAKAIDLLWEKANHRIDIIYICANRDIAAQNIKRLNLTREDRIAYSSRLTLLPIDSKDLHSRLNFISFTPGTSFDLRSRAGIARERALIYRVLRDSWGFGNKAAPRNLLQGDINRESWDWWVNEIYKIDEINEEIIKRFISLLKEKNVRKDFDHVVQNFSRFKYNIPSEDKTERNSLISNLRSLLAHACVGALEPDLVILDEFQRFKNLLENAEGEENNVAQLARTLFNHQGAKVLLLSATPYKMYTMGHETEDDHYNDFLHTVDFLFNHDKDKKNAFGQELENYRKTIYDLGPRGFDHLRTVKDRIEKTLRSVMVRTERLATTIDRNGMVENARLEECKLRGDDLRAFAMIDTLAQECGVTDMIEYWKSAPYLLNFMGKDEYVFKKKIVDLIKNGKLRARAVRKLEASKDLMLTWKNSIERYQRIDPCNAKLRAVLANTVEKKACEMLWIPPSMPYYNSNGPAERNHLQTFTKALIFSSWKVVPKVIATLCSYEAERHIMQRAGNTHNYDDAYAKRSQLITFKAAGEKLKGMNFFTLLYPSCTLASMIDPLAIALELAKDGRLPSVDEVKQVINAKIDDLLKPVFENYGISALSKSREDAKSSGDSWYAALLGLLDRYYCKQQVTSWRELEKKRNEEDSKNYPWGSSGTTDEEDESRFEEHVGRFWQYYEKDALPKSLPEIKKVVEVLTNAAMGSPAILGLRALMRLGKENEWTSYSGQLLSEASRVAWGFRSLFNQPDSITIIRGQRGEGNEESYWEEALDYCIEGNLQSVLDEYIHVLRESLGQYERPLGDAARAIVDELTGAVSIQTIRLSFDEFEVKDKKIRFDQSRRIRCRFAMRYGDEIDDDGKTETRADQVRKAFNSPFRPFILASTSVGQEGIDFHYYCHSIYHWNLPSNPVDFEQREGRIHRYKGHVIRKNVAEKISFEGLKCGFRALEDPWDKLFNIARKNREPKYNDIVPYWIFEHKHKIKRYVLALPLSREQEHFERLKRSIAAYRMVFGQPRQEDLLAYLQKRLEEGLTNEDIILCRIDLSVKSPVHKKSL